MLNLIVELIANLIFLYNFILFVYCVLSILISFNIVNKHQPFILRLNYALTRLVEPALKPIRRILPDLGGIDISPVILILLLNFISKVLYHFLYSF